MKSKNSKKEIKKEIVFRLYNQSSDIESLLKNINRFLDLDEDTKISGLVLISKYDLIQEFPTRYLEKFSKDITNLGDNINNLHLKVERKNKEIIEGNCLLITRDFLPNVYILLTHESTNFLNKCVIPYFSKYYPYISKSNISTKNFQRILESFESTSIERRIRITRYSSKSWVNSENAKKKVASEVKWTDVPFRDIFDSIYANNEWLKSIDFKISSENPTENNQIFFNEFGKYKIYRDGRFQCNSNFLDFYNRVIESIANNASKNLKLYDFRQKTKEDNYFPKPILIEYDLEIFSDKKENLRLIETLNKIKNSSLSVYHGNPYLSTSYVDYNDGSSYEIWVLTNSSITIIPQMRSTPAALERLVEAISTGFREGTIMDFKDEYD